MTELIKLLTLASVVFLSSCINTDTHKLLGSTQGNLRILATATPTTNKDSTTITKIELKDKDTGLLEVIWMYSELQLQIGTVTTLRELKLSVGEYDELRLFTDGASEEEPTLIPISSPLAVNSRISSELLLEFNSSTVRAINLSMAGTLKGLVTGTDDLPLEGALVNISLNDTLTTSAITGADGQFKAIGLEEGNYTVAVSAEGYAPTEIHHVYVSVGDEVEENFHLQENLLP